MSIAHKQTASVISKKEYGCKCQNEHVRSLDIKLRHKLK
jgi:hypothetical protein